MVERYNSRVIVPSARCSVIADEAGLATLKIDAADTSVFPKYDATGWTAMEALMMSSPCFAWLMRDQDFGNAIPGKGLERIIEKVSSVYDIDHDHRIFEPPAHLDEMKDQELAEYARHNFYNMIDRDEMVAVEPDENGRLFVPEGTRPVLLTVFRTKAANPAMPQFGRHWYGADQPKEEGAEVPWSHWTGDGVPTRFSGAGNITNPWTQCAFEKARYVPVSYFLMPGMEK